MKFLIASDIHGSATWCHKFIDAVHAEKPDKIILLGDILYHGPRNALPDGYDPKEVIALLNPLADRIIAVRGNCDAEVDQMVLNFPCMADYSTILDPEYIDEDAGYEMQTPRTLLAFRFPKMVATATARTLPDCQSKSHLSTSF